MFHQAEQHAQGERVYVGIAGFREGVAERDRGDAGEGKTEQDPVHYGQGGEDRAFL